ncbi:MAG TPA: hypothetical protein VEK35_10885 [Roseiarcus sp.]|nr:hypothetical protein [Roseiarcus sp.]
MKALSAAVAQIFGLFVDDAGLALLAMLSIGVMTLFVKFGVIAPLAGALGVGVGCAVALAASLFRATQRTGS